MDNMQKYSLMGLNVPAEEFLNTMFDIHENVNIRVFEDQGDGDFKGQNLTYPLEQFISNLKSLSGRARIAFRLRILLRWNRSLM